jgi:hypothetical protein
MSVDDQIAGHVASAIVHYDIESEQTAMLLTQEEWSDLSDICKIFKALYRSHPMPFPPRTEELCDRIIAAA